MTNFPVDREDRKVGRHNMLNHADGITIAKIYGRAPTLVLVRSPWQSTKQSTAADDREPRTGECCIPPTSGVLRCVPACVRAVLVFQVNRRHTEADRLLSGSASLHVHSPNVIEDITRLNESQVSPSLYGPPNQLVSHPEVGLDRCRSCWSRQAGP
jgi:hypothetical protein